MKDIFSDRISNITASGIRKIFDLASKMKNPINFSIGQADFDVPDEIKKEAIKSIEQGKNRYTVTQGIKELREEVSKEIKRTRNIERDPEKELFITCGTSGGLVLAMLVLVNPGDEVILPDPYFVIYKHLVSLTQGIPKYYDLYPDFKLKPEKIEELITEKTKIILINSPSNPTGMVFDEDSLKKVAEIAKKHNLIIISDEIYDYFVYDTKHYSISTYYEKTILLGGFSKSFGMPGWRMGYAAGPSEIIDKMATLQQFTFVCAPAPAQYGCVKAFNIDMTPYIKEYKVKRDLIYNGLKEIGYDVNKPGGSFYIFPKVPWGTDKEFCEKAIKNNLLIIPGSAFSKKDTHFRISFAVPNDKIKEGLDILKKLFNKEI